MMIQGRSTASIRFSQMSVVLGSSMAHWEGFFELYDNGVVVFWPTRRISLHEEIHASWIHFPERYLAMTGYPTTVSSLPSSVL